MKGYLSTVALLLFSGYACATQLEIKNLEYRYPASTEMQYRVPWFTSKESPQVAKRINDYIFASFINQLPGNNPQTTVNQFANSEMNPTANLDYTIEYRDANVLTLNMFVEGCGAYCESYNVPISFDLASGAAITLNDLFSRSTMAELNTRIRKDIRSQIDTFVTAQKDGGDPGYAEFYASCATYIDGLYYIDRFSLQKDHLAFLNGRCSNHANRAGDELGDFTTKIPTGELHKQFTPYGQYLTGAKSTTPVEPTPGIDGKVMYGTLGKSMRIVLKVDCKYGDFFEGAYFYQKFGAPIELTGKCDTADNRHYELKTSAAEQSEEKITLELKDGVYQGVWESNGKTLPVRFE
ncbi:MULTISPECIES: hypothetical protein [Citrobacter]|uniref:hypothetical protein n=1 Tax=Citrobacter TaxID=544 RepID=UPI00088DFCC4|nr:MULTISPECIES: hypothetical protein [Citrobacter]MDM3276928.1 hypothetical protein [Citrobacter sp. Ce119]MDM3291973.1 hypothetical protein [Citrobacter sp. Ce105]UBI17068.1 hypothetical protein LA337_05055 [Citrobacter europaeus]CAD7563894.1 hypothetical protein CIP106467_4010 [Citrobacter europaeus]GIZ17063.1 hypothetical protein TUM12147_03990 [Citrobacter europaeus]